MKVKFETDYNDLAEAAWLSSGANSYYKKALSNLSIFYALIAGLSSLPVLLFAPHFIFALLDFLIIFIACFYFFKPSSRKQFTNQYKNVYGSKPFNYEVKLEEDCVTLRGILSQSIISWKKVKEISETENNIFLIFKYKNGLKIPKTAFNEPAQISKFVDFAKSHILNEESLYASNNQ